MTGMRPMAEIMFGDFFAVCWDIVANEIAKARYMTNGHVSCPLVIGPATAARSASGRSTPSARDLDDGRPRAEGGRALEPADMMAPGRRLRDPDPVLFFEHKNLCATKGEVPTARTSTPRQGLVGREGGDPRSWPSG